MDESRARIGVVVVAFNAATTLVRTLDRIPNEFRAQLAELIVLDDASHDDTFILAKNWAAEQPRLATFVVRHEKNVGYGGNQKAAYALASKHGLDIVVLLHGDGQYAPELLPEMVRPIVAGEADAVFGSRMMIRGAARKGGMPLYKWAGNKILTWIENRLLGTSLSEFHSGYRAYRVDTLDRLPLSQNSDGFDFDTQIIVQLVDRGARIVEVPIPTYYGDEICYVNGMRYAGDVIQDVAEYRLAKVGFGTAPWIPTPEEYGFKEGDGSSHAMILDMLADLPPLRVLDLGCSGGLLGEQLVARGHEVTGVDQVSIEGVEDRVDHFVQADLSRPLVEAIDGLYDVVILGDVLEHLPRPLDTLRQVEPLLDKNGQVIISVPNFGHWYPRARAASGTFGYDRRGPLDETHLRFFTRRTLRRFVTRAGYDIVEERYTGLPLGVLAAGDGRIARTVRKFDARAVWTRPQLFAYQFVMRIVPHAEGTETIFFEPCTRPESLAHGDSSRSTVH